MIFTWVSLIRRDFEIIGVNFILLLDLVTVRLNYGLVECRDDKFGGWLLILLWFDYGFWFFFLFIELLDFVCVEFWWDKTSWMKKMSGFSVQIGLVWMWLTDHWLEFKWWNIIVSDRFRSCFHQIWKVGWWKSVFVWVFRNQIRR